MLSSQCRRYLIAILFLLFCFRAIAQVNTADVTGTVTDSTGATIAGATVTITSTATGIAREATTNNSGVWAIPSLVPGTYLVEIAKPGFAPARLENIQLSANEVRPLNVTMKVGATSQVVKVTTSSVINLDNAQQQTTLGARQLSLLPVPNRDWTSMVTQGNGLSMDRDSRGVLSMNGLPGGGTNITVDGVPAAGQAGLPSFGIIRTSI
jgi:hypothetical protein